MATLCVPSAHSQRLAYASQLPTEDPDDDSVDSEGFLDSDIEDDYVLDGDNEDFVEISQGKNYGKLTSNRSDRENRNRNRANKFINDKHNFAVKSSPLGFGADSRMHGRASGRGGGARNGQNGSGSGSGSDSGDRGGDVEMTTQSHSADSYAYVGKTQQSHSQSLDSYAYMPRGADEEKGNGNGNLSGSGSGSRGGSYDEEFEKTLYSGGRELDEIFAEDD
jgi:hypothetical protein